LRNDGEQRAAACVDVCAARIKQFERIKLTNTNGSITRHLSHFIGGIDLGASVEKQRIDQELRQQSIAISNKTVNSRCGFQPNCQAQLR
jgi:hypothetical protein